MNLGDRATPGSVAGIEFQAKHRKEVETMSKPGNQAAMRRMIAAHEAAGGHWFTKGAMRFFRSRIETGLIAGEYFVSSEQFVPYDGDPEPRRYTIRRFDPSDSFTVETVGEFQEFDTLADALALVDTDTERK